MRRIVQTMLAASVAVSLLFTLGACSTLQGIGSVVFGGEVPKNYLDDARKAYAVALAGWESVQLGIEKYGTKPDCPPGQFIGCRNAAAWAVIKPIQHKVSLLIESTRPVVKAGSNDVQLLVGVASAVYDAQQALVNADPTFKAVVPPPPAPSPPAAVATRVPAPSN